MDCQCPKCTYKSTAPLSSQTITVVETLASAQRREAMGSEDALGEIVRLLREMNAKMDEVQARLPRPHDEDRRNRYYCGVCRQEFQYKDELQFHKHVTT